MVDPRLLPMQSATSNHGGKTGRREERRDAGTEETQPFPFPPLPLKKKQTNIKNIHKQTNTEEAGRCWRYLHEDSVPNMAGPGAVMERGRRRRKERREKGGGVRERERERWEVDEQAATQRGSSKQHNAAKPAVTASQTARCPSSAIRRCFKSTPPHTQ